MKEENKRVLVHKDSNCVALQIYKLRTFVGSSLGLVLNSAYFIGSGCRNFLPIKPFGHAGGLSFFGRIVNNLRFIGAI